MPRILALFLGLALVAAAAGPTAAVARGGEDWPFFCTMTTDHDVVDAMRLVRDDQSPSGYGLQLYQQGVFIAYTYPQLSKSDDERFRVVFGVVPGIVKVGPFNWQDLQVLAYLATAESAQSWGDAAVAPQGEQGDFAKNPMACRAEHVSVLHQE